MGGVIKKIMIVISDVNALFFRCELAIDDYIVCPSFGYLHKIFHKKNFKTIAYRIAANLLMERKLMKMAIMVIINRKVNYNYTLG